MSAQVKVKKVSDTKKKLTIKVGKDAMSPYYDKAYKKVGAKAKIPGFRQGKIPNNILDKHYGPEVTYEALNYLVDDTYREALTQEELVPLVQPKFDVGPLLREADYEYAVEIEVKPDFKLKTYKGLKLKNRTEKVEASEIEKELDGLRERFAESEPAKDGDDLQEGFVATIDFEGKIDGTPFPGGTAKDYSLNYGKGLFLKPFEDQIKGMKKGEERDIKVPFPDDYFEKSLAGKEAEFHVTLKNLHRKKLPTLDDELAKDVGKESLQDLKDDITKHLERAKLQKVRPEYLEEIRTKILKDYKFEIPEGLVLMQMQQEAETAKQNPEFKARSKDDVTDQLRFELVLESIAVEEKVQPTPEEVHQHLMYYAQMYKKPLPEIQKVFSENGMLPQILTRITLEKTIDLMIENAKLS